MDNTKKSEEVPTKVTEKNTPADVDRTLTDKLNKKLLSSFLERMNNGSIDNIFKDDKNTSSSGKEDDEFAP